MGYASALGMAEVAGVTEQTIGWHLSANHFPPVPSSMIGPCMRAIELANDGEWDHQVQLPEGIEYRGTETAPVHAIVEQHHLEAFLS